MPVLSGRGKDCVGLVINPENVAVANILIASAGLRTCLRIIFGLAKEILMKLIRVDKEEFQVGVLLTDNWKICIYQTFGCSSN